ncbi:hypothetical protein NP233_g429 [Leucocoprinus birnbaumii]|uniref:Uncharacterized protein n=1 Tax=Leucocoprinus birnbaumii TaxID=56174 RepID=A0AAD5W260_9AGAR|nr:hypothetical protein NP233_g429 [Leucocoprinus birnbaumii]
MGSSRLESRLPSASSIISYPTTEPGEDICQDRDVSMRSASSKSASNPDVASTTSVSTPDNSRLPSVAKLLSTLAEQDVRRKEDAIKSVVAAEVERVVAEQDVRRKEDTIKSIVAAEASVERTVKELLVALGITVSNTTSTKVGSGGAEPVQTPEIINSTQSALHLKRKRSDPTIVIESSIGIGTFNVYMNLSSQPRSPPSSATGTPAAPAVTPVKRQKTDDTVGPSHEREKEKKAASSSADKKD